MLENDTSTPKKASDTEILEDVNNEFLNRLLNHKVLKFFYQNTSTKLAIATALITIGSFFIKVLGYMYLKGYLSIFSIPIDSVGYSSSHGFSEFLINGTIFIGLAIAVSFAYMHIEFMISQHRLRKAKYSITATTFLKRVKLLFSDVKSSILWFLGALFIVELINFLLWIFMSSGKLLFTYTVIEWTVSLLVLTIMEIITALQIFLFRDVKSKKLRKEKKRIESLTQTERETEKMKKEFISLQKNSFIDIITSSAVLLFFLYSTGAYLSGAISAQQKKTFPIIEHNYAVVYQNQQYYWLISSQEQVDGSLLLNTQNQKILDVNGVEVVIKSYDEIINGN